jgi:hypothetical protein
MIARKQSGAPILGSMAYLRMLLDFEPYACYPLLVPRVMPDGGLAYPCRPIEREGALPGTASGAHGGRAVNLLDVPNWPRPSAAPPTSTATRLRRAEAASNSVTSSRPCCKRARGIGRGCGCGTRLRGAGTASRMRRGRSAEC